MPVLSNIAKVSSSGASSLSSVNYSADSDGRNVGPYQVAGGSDQFNSRSNDIFSALQGYEAAHDRHEESHAEENRGLVRADPSALDFPSAAATSGHSSRQHLPPPPPGAGATNTNSPQQLQMDYYFRRHAGTSGRSRGDAKRRAPASVPDHVINPHKYTKYSLDDVSSDDVSEVGNRNAALAFFAERRQMKENAEEPTATTANIRQQPDSMDTAPERIRFRSSKERIVDNAAERSSGCGGESAGGRRFESDGKLVMAEYVVGCATAAPRRRKSPALTSAAVTLGAHAEGSGTSSAPIHPAADTDPPCTTANTALTSTLPFRDIDDMELSSSSPQQLISTCQLPSSAKGQFKKRNSASRKNIRSRVGEEDT